MVAGLVPVVTGLVALVGGLVSCVACVVALVTGVITLVARMIPLVACVVSLVTDVVTLVARVVPLVGGLVSMVPCLVPGAGGVIPLVARIPRLALARPERCGDFFYVAWTLTHDRAVSDGEAPWCESVPLPRLDVPPHTNAKAVQATRVPRHLELKSRAARWGRVR